jgi:1-acyl-sn-glycerol-3-phosphate acyltransferase
MQIRNYFSGDAYDTRHGKQRWVTDRLFLGSRWCFVGGYVGEVVRARSLAVKERYDRAAWVESSHRIFDLIEGCGGCFHLKGLKNLSACQDPVVFISNHMSMLETFVFPCIIAPLREVTFVVKESLVKHFLFGPVMRSRNPIVVTRKNPREDFQVVMKEGKELLAKGTSIIIFPQSTRQAEFNPEGFNSLGIKLARAGGVPAIPVAIKTDFWENGKYFKDVGPVNRHKPIHMAFGKPMEITGGGKEEHMRIVEFIADHLRQWGGTVKGA